MRITTFPYVLEIKEQYIQLRKDGNSRTDAVTKLIEQNKNELQMGVDDDALLFWVGLADGQYDRKELSEDVAQHAIAALDKLEALEFEITPGDIERRRKNYANAPMSEKRVGKPKPKFRCGWNVGDTFAYKVSGPDAEKYGISGKYMLLRKVSDVEFGDGRLLPIVTVSLWDKEPLPVTREEFMSVPLLKLSQGRFLLPKGIYEYRTEIIVKNQKQLDSLGLVYLGNFENIPKPKDEVIIDHPAMIMMTLPNKLDRDLSVYWHLHKYYSRME